MPSIPKKIRTDMLFNKIFVIVAGFVCCGALFGIQEFLLASADVKFDMETLTMPFIICYILMIVFLIIYPSILLIFKVDSKKIQKDMKRCGIDERALYSDYTSASKHGKTQCEDQNANSHTFGDF